MFEQAEYQAMMERQRRDTTLHTARTFIEKAHQAEVAADALMGDPHWKVYQQLLAGAAEKLRETQVRLRDQVSSVAMVSHDEIMRTKLLLAETTGIIAGIESALNLPRQIRDDFAKAEATIAELTKNQGEEHGGSE